MDSFILCGMQFGDEGKGTFVDYLAHKEKVDAIVRYNGGSQASHTVITPEGILHKFSQLGSGMFLKKCHTYLTQNMVINLENLLVELEVFSKKTGIPIPELMQRLHIHEECFIVTPYHKLINKLRELSKGEKRRGTVGTGVSEVKYLLSIPKEFPYEQLLGIQVKDIFDPYNNYPMIGKLERLQEYVREFYEKHKEAIWQNAPEELKEQLERQCQELLSTQTSSRLAIWYATQLKQAPQETNLSRCIYTTYEQTLRKQCSSVIYEGAQGLLLDATYGLKPNTTFLDTTNHFALDISYYRDNVRKIGIIKAFTSRHGKGPFPTESKKLSEKISDANQEETYWNGKIRFGWFDAVLLRYAQKINQVDELYVSSVDQLTGMTHLQICNEYLYRGSISGNEETFAGLFDYYVENEQIIITDIRKEAEELGSYLANCTPRYLIVKGWQANIAKITQKEKLPKKCIEYLSLLEKLTHLPITVISVGPTRNDKITM